MTARLGLIAATLVALAAGGAIAATMAVSQSNRNFAPMVVTVKKGDVVTIRNEDSVIHHLYVDQPNMQFDSGEQPVGKTVEVKFPDSGTFEVLCAIHPKMKLTVTVE